MAQILATQVLRANVKVGTSKKVKWNRPISFFVVKCLYQTNSSCWSSFSGNQQHNSSDQLMFP